MISAAMYRTYYHAGIAESRARNTPPGAGACTNTSDGDLWYVIDDFLLGTEVDAYMDNRSGRGNGLEGVSRLNMAARSLSWANVDCGNLLSFGSKDEIRARHHRVHRVWASEAGGHIFTASNAIHPDSIPIQNYLAMVNAYREFWKLGKVRLNGLRMGVVTWLGKPCG